VVRVRECERRRPEPELGSWSSLLLESLGSSVGCSLLNNGCASGERGDCSLHSLPRRLLSKPESSHAPPRPPLLAPFASTLSPAGRHAGCRDAGCGYGNFWRSCRQIRASPLHGCPYVLCNSQFSCAARSAGNPPRGDRGTLRSGGGGAVGALLCCGARPVSLLSLLGPSWCRFRHCGPTPAACQAGSTRESRGFSIFLNDSRWEGGLP